MDVPSYGVTNSISSEPSATRIRALGIVFVGNGNLSGTRLCMLVQECGSASYGFNPRLRFRRDMFTRGSTYLDDVGGEEREWGLPRNGQEL